jgi:hypothetical protein
MIKDTRSGSAQFPETDKLTKVSETGQLLHYCNVDSSAAAYKATLAQIVQISLQASLTPDALAHAKQLFTTALNQIAILEYAIASGAIMNRSTAPSNTPLAVSTAIPSLLDDCPDRLELKTDGLTGVERVDLIRAFVANHPCVREYLDGQRPPKTFTTACNQWLKQSLKPMWICLHHHFNNDAHLFVEHHSDSWAFNKFKKKGACCPPGPALA